MGTGSSPSQDIDIILIKFREEGRTDSLPYLLEYGLNLYLKNLTMSHLARVLPVEENPMLSELIGLTGITKYKTTHQAGWLNTKFDEHFEDSEQATGYSSYQVYLWYLENWPSLPNWPNIDRLCDTQKQIENTGMRGVGGVKYVTMAAGETGRRALSAPGRGINSYPQFIDAPW